MENDLPRSEMVLVNNDLITHASHQTLLQSNLGKVQNTPCLSWTSFGIFHNKNYKIHTVSQFNTALHTFNKSNLSTNKYQELKENMPKIHKKSKVIHICLNPCF